MSKLVLSSPDESYTGITVTSALIGFDVHRWISRKSENLGDQVRLGALGSATSGFNSVYRILDAA